MFLTMGKIRECELFSEHGNADSTVKIFIPNSEYKVEHLGMRVLGIRWDVEEDVYSFFHEGNNNMSGSYNTIVRVRLDVYRIKWEKIDYPSTI